MGKNPVIENDDIYADENVEDRDRTMTTADLVSEESDGIQDSSGLMGTVDSSGLVGSVERCQMTNASVSSGLATIDQTAGLKTAAGFDIRKFTSAISGAKSNSEIEKILRQYSQKPSEITCAPAPRKSSEISEVSGSGDAGESHQSGRITPLDSRGSPAGNSTLTASTKSYSWSSSLPNGSRLETLASNVACEQRESSSSSTADAASVDEAGPVADSANAAQQVVSSSARQVAEPDVATHQVVSSRTQQVSIVNCERRSSARKSRVRVGDFLPSASETTFGSPRVSLIAQLSRRRHYDECTLDQSQFDRSVTVTASFQPAVSTNSRLMSTPATSFSNDSAVVHVSSSQTRNHPFSQFGRSRSLADVGSLQLAAGQCDFSREIFFSYSFHFS